MTERPFAVTPDSPDRFRVSEECRLNPLWIETALGGEAALEISVPGLGLKSGLETYFRKVEQYPADSLTSPSPSPQIGFSDRTFDLVTLFGMNPDSEVLREVVRVLKPSGLLYLAVENRWWIGRFRRRGMSRGRDWSSGGPGLAGLVRSAGFSTVRQYFLFPSLDRPEHVVPAHLPALRARETLLRRDEDAGVLRRAFVRLGLFQFLYPGRLIIARI